MESILAPRRDPSAILARALSLTALVICLIAFAAILIQGAPTAPATSAAAPQVERLETSAARLADVLRAGGNARRALHEAWADANAVAAAVKRAEAAGLPTTVRLAAALRSHRLYLHAVAASLRD